MSYYSHFWILVYEQDRLYNLSKNIKNIYNLIDPDMNEKDRDVLTNIFDKIKNFQFTKLRYLNKTIKSLSNIFPIKQLQKQSSELWKEYDELISEYRLTGKNKYLIMIIDSEYEPEYHSPYSIYKFLISLDIIRNGKTYSVADDMILDIFNEDEDLYRESLFVNTIATGLYINSFYATIFETYLNRKYPIYHKDSLRQKKSISCNESSNGILRGIVHMINYRSEIPEEQLLSEIIDSGYLEIKFDPRNSSSGVFTTLLGYGNEVKDLLDIEWESGIYLIMSLATLDEYDYWGGIHGMGSRKKTDFYKGICHKCGDGLEKYSAAERYFMAMSGDNYEKFYELIFSNDINLNKYLEAIYIPSELIRDKIFKSEIIPDRIKSLVIDKIPRKQVFRKGCKDKDIKKIEKKTFDKMVKLVKRREDMTEIPKVNYHSINMKRKVKILYNPFKSEGGSRFPIPE